MFWRLAHSSSLDSYHHGEAPCALIVYTMRTELLGADMCNKLLSRGFDVLVITINTSSQSSLQQPLRASHPDRKVDWFTMNAEDGETISQLAFEAIHTKNLTLVVYCSDSSAWSKETPMSRSSISPGSVSPSELFVEIQRACLPILVEHTPASLLLVSNTLTSFPESREKFHPSIYLEAFVSTLSQELRSSGHNGVQVMYMDYYDTANNDETSSIVSAQRADLSESILRAVGRHSTHVIPFWSDELIVWFVWLILWILPQKVVRRLVPYP
ncbi:hypothetical protein DFH11DRAFT_1008166 [Phellopilus nigrolimitatus]|nr:hypothetical protein DFH11DRAFT_1008166 [Phellopilus nigrolimitatus]